MSTRAAPSTSFPSKPSLSFEQQRAALVMEIAASMESVLQNINKLNRNLEGVIAVGNEFGAVEALWSQVENVMAKEETNENQKGSERGEDEEEEEKEEDTVVEERK